MNFELHVTFDSEGSRPSEILRATVERLACSGWDGIALTRDVASLKKVPPPPDRVTLSPTATAIVQRRYSAYVLGDFVQFPQFTRLNLVTDDIAEVRQLPRAMDKLSYDIYSVTPLSDDVFSAVCSTSDVDIVAIDPTKYMPRHKWKDLKAASKRNIAIEFPYARYLGSDANFVSLIKASSSATHATSGRSSGSRNFLLGLGCDEPTKVRCPGDVRAIAGMLRLPDPGNIAGKAVKQVIARGLARKTQAGAVRRMKDVVVDEDEIDIVVKDIV